MHDYRRLDVWRRARRLVVQVYRVTRGFPADERFGMIPQIRTAATSIPANIAEGAGRFTDREFRRFLAYASGSAYELESHLLISGDLNFAPHPDLAPLLAEIDDLKPRIISLARSLK